MPKILNYGKCPSCTKRIIFTKNKITADSRCPHCATKIKLSSTFKALVLVIMLMVIILSAIIRTHDFLVFSYALTYLSIPVLFWMFGYELSETD